MLSIFSITLWNGRCCLLYFISLQYFIVVGYDKATPHFSKKTEYEKAGDSLGPTLSVRGFANTNTTITKPHFQGLYIIINVFIF